MMLSNIFQNLKNSFYELNFFRAFGIVNNRHQIINQQISTRIYILSYTLIIIFIFLYLFLSPVTINGTTKILNQTLFEEFNNKYHENIQCPCSNLSIPYRTFISLERIYHPICSYNLESMINVLFNYTESLTNYNDFRFTGALQFRLLTLLCSSVDEMIRARLIDFNETLFTTIYLLKESNLRDQVEELINEFIQMITNNFVNSLKMIRINMFGSQLISGVRSNYKIMGYNWMHLSPYHNLSYFFNFWNFSAHSYIYDGPCDCSTSFLCSSYAVIYDHNKKQIVNGFRIGCFILESLLASSLECFYNQSCLNQLLQHIQLNSSLILLPSSKFNKTDSVEMLLNGLMVEQWENSIDYKAYFTACRANTCSYSYKGRRSSFLIVTTMLGMIGGLVTILRFIVPTLVAYVRKKRYFQTTSSQNSFRRFYRSLKLSKLIKEVRLINLFKSFDSHTELDIRNEFFSTRLYVILLSITLIVLINYYSLLLYTIPIIIESPSLDKIIHMNELSISCPCSTTDIPLKRFISIKQIFHPICSSDFIDDIWLNNVYTMNNDVRQLQMRFRLLSLFCELSKQILESEFLQFGNNHLANIELLSRYELEARLNSSLEQTISKARSIFAKSLQLVVNGSQINKLLSADEAFRPIDAGVYLVREIPTRFCTKCDEYIDCVYSNKLGNITFNQFYTNCDSIQALLMSSLVSFYDVNIVTSLNHFIGNVLYRPLNSPYSYSKNASISYILNTLMLDTYSMNLSYELYFNKCNPQICTYTKISHESLADRILTIIGLIGGLTGILHFLIWHSIRYIRKPKKIYIENIEEQNNFNLIIFLRNKFLSLNIFRETHHSKQNQIISTRIFIFLFIIILVILIFYTTLTSITHSITIKQPTYEELVSLDKTYSLTLICPCSNMAISYQSFISFSPEFHQICSSVFTDNKFIDLFPKNPRYFTSTNDLSRFVWYIFTTIRNFCDSSRRTVEDQINTFLETKFISSQVISEHEFYPQIYRVIQSMIQTTQRQTTITIKLIRDTTYINQIISNLFTNFDLEKFDIHSYSNETRPIGLTNYRYGNCNCLTSPSCFQSAYTQRWPHSPKYYFDGMFTGCYILESILRSSMECFYSQKCLNRTLLLIITGAYLDPPKDIIPFPIALERNLNSSFYINTTFSQLIDNLMTETWNQSISHRSYSESCKPSSCTYTFTDRRELGHIITILFSIVGGLNTILRIIVPHFVSIIIKFINRNRVISLN